MATKFVAYITLRNGVRLYAHQVGLRAFPIEVSDEETSDKKTTHPEEE
jgi:hypothetical protein